MKKKLLALSLMFLMMFSFLVGCGNTDGDDDGGSQKESFVVTDMAGREVTIPAEIDSIATFGSIGVINTFVELMGEGDKIANEMSANFTKSDKWKYQYKFAPQLSDGPVLESNGEIDMEAVLELNPDLCIVMTKEYADLLEAQGLTVIYFEWFSQDDVKDCIEFLGEVFGKEDIADDYIEYFDDTMAKADKLTEGLSEEEKKKVLYGSVIEGRQPHNIAEWWMTQAGGISVTDDGRAEGDKKTFTAEDVLKWNPDVILITSASEKEEILATDTYAGVKAVSDDRIYAVPTVGHVWGNRTPEQPLTVMWTLNKLYPDIYSDEDLSKEIEYFYSTFFDYDLSDEEIHEIIYYQ